MRSSSVSAFLLVCAVLAVLRSASAAAQETSSKAADLKCDGPVYKVSEVARRARFTSRPQPVLTKEALANGVRGNVVLIGVLCRTGRVTDIQVIEGLPFGVTEQAVEAARRTQFTPAEKDGLAVSQAIRFEFGFRYIGERRPLARGPLEGRTIEFVEVGGYRDEQKDKVDACLRDLSGQLYDREQIDLVWQKLLALGDFDKEASTLRIEEGDRGGLSVVFELKGRPKI